MSTREGLAESGRQTNRDGVVTCRCEPERDAVVKFALARSRDRGVYRCLRLAGTGSGSPTSGQQQKNLTKQSAPCMAQTKQTE